MKGMHKIKRGKSFAGVVFYALRPASHHKVDPVVIGGNMMGSFAKELIAEFGATKTLRSDVAKPVWHNSLRLPKNEALTNSEWAIIADDYMKRMGFSETHLRCYVLHDDKAGQHIHIIASRIELSSGKLYLGKNENLISTRIIQQLERDYSLTRTKGLELVASPSTASPYPKPKRKKSRNEAMMEKRTGELCPKTIIQNALEVFLADKPSTTEFVHQLVAQNIRAIPNIASTGRMNGFSFEYQGIVFKASQLGKGYSWSALQNKLDYQPDRDNDFLFDLKASVSEGSEIVIPTETITEDVNSPIEVIIPDNSAGMGEYTNASVKQLHLEAGAGPKEAYTTELLKEAPDRSYVTTTFRWLETIPYLNTIITILKNLKIPTLKRPGKHKTITGVRVVEITPLPQKNLIESASQSRRTTLSM
ncbi:relaxase/mobilization nuclease domain-containing protein [Photorhabdus tasmaniensis]|uniref:relaxase/mobilization nuclease domain-containing protein n=1 Tax=Photorhabdus tasmaniensis TaxID=1004159 RepID=UPI00404225D3